MPTIELMADIEILKATVAHLEGEVAVLRAALVEQMLWEGQEIGGMLLKETHTRECFLGILKGTDCLGRCQRARAALSDTGEGWAEVREQVKGVIEELFSLADRIPAEVRQRTEATLAALEVT